MNKSVFGCIIIKMMMCYYLLITFLVILNDLSASNPMQGTRLGSVHSVKRVMCDCQVIACFKLGFELVICLPVKGFDYILCLQVVSLLHF